MPHTPHEYRGRLTTAEDARRYVLGDFSRGSARWTSKTITLVSAKTDRSFTYLIARPPGDGLDRPWIIKILTGPNNRTDYVYLGLIRPVHDGEIPYDDGAGHTNPLLPSTVLQHTQKSGLPTTAPGWRALDYLHRHVLRDAGGTLPAPLGVWQEGSCGVCGRRLSRVESIARGVGPVCAARFGG